MSILVQFPAKMMLHPDNEAGGFTAVADLDHICRKQGKYDTLGFDWRSQPNG